MARGTIVQEGTPGDIAEPPGHATRETHRDIGRGDERQVPERQIGCDEVGDIGRGRYPARIPGMRVEGTRVLDTRWSERFRIDGRDDEHDRRCGEGGHVDVKTGENARVACVRLRVHVGRDGRSDDEGWSFSHRRRRMYMHSLPKRNIIKE